MADASGALSIGELAALTGTTVKTVRFYSDRGLLPESGRSGGGHRRYRPEAAARLRAIRSLRSLGVPVPEIAGMLEEPPERSADALDSVVDRRLEELGAQLSALRWREAALRALREGAPEQRAELLGLLGAIEVPPSTSAIAHYWRRLLPPRLSARLRRSVTEAAVPQPPAEPTPGQVLAFARLHALAAAATDGCLATSRPSPPAAHPDLLYDGLHEAYLLAEAGRSATALDCYVGAHARASGVRDTPGFRRALLPALAAADHPVMSRYWQLAEQLTPPRTLTLGAADLRLRSALAADVAL
ncbi:helix-turn-helix domain-containing protein [Phaeacidiphilus oryzae]|uniref:helix-turn-helix domain-containing protein n=1 Tax=Phaeacidiphilus oryzae TaxID=348818 RepID=UPI00055EDE95|nr:MerR family transcriptional regulator [Phaeacidiphilus oryzae]